MATGDRGVARRAESGGFGAVPLGFVTDAPAEARGASLHRTWDSRSYERTLICALICTPILLVYPRRAPYKPYGEWVEMTEAGVRESDEK